MSWCVIENRREKRITARNQYEMVWDWEVENERITAHYAV